MSIKKQTDWFDVLLGAMPSTVDEMSKKLGVHRSTINVWLKRLREAGWVHIVAWKKAHTTHTPVYQAGQGVSVPHKIALLTEEEKERRSEDLFMARRRREVQKQITQLLARGPASPFDALFQAAR